jgi:hypothetical protein
MIDILYLAHNRLEFTKASLAVLIENTNWQHVDKLIIYDDSSSDGTSEYLQKYVFPIKTDLRFGIFGSPVSIMNDYLCNLDSHDHRVFAKIDSDTMVPTRWLDTCLSVMSRNPDLDLLGIEAFNQVITGNGERGYTQARYIGGIGMMRAGAFVTLPRPSGRFGFTAWQENTPRVKKGWIDPSLPVFLLDRLPREPWRSLALEYVAKGWAREWGPYSENDKALWSWWIE